MLLLQEQGLLSPFVAKLINLAIYVAILIFLLRKPLVKFLDNRAKEIDDQVQRAEREKQAALEKLKAVEERLSRLDAEIAEIKAQTAAEAQAEYDRIAASAREDATKMHELATREISSLTKAARLELKSYAAEEAVNLAEGLIRRELAPADEQRIVDEYIKELEGKRQ